MPRATSTRRTNRPTKAVSKAESNEKSAQGHDQLSDANPPACNVQSSIDSVLRTVIMPGAAGTTRESKGIRDPESDSKKDTEGIPKKKKHTADYDPARHASKIVGLEGDGVGSRKDKDGRLQDKYGPGKDTGDSRKDKDRDPRKGAEGSRKSNRLRGEDKDVSRKPSSRREKGKGGSQKDNVDSKEETIGLPTRDHLTLLPDVKPNRRSRK